MELWVFLFIAGEWDQMAFKGPFQCRLLRGSRMGLAVLCTNSAQLSTAQHSSAQHSSAQLSTAQHSMAQHGWHSTTQHSTAQHGPVWHGMAQSSVAWHGITLHGPAQRSTALHSTAHSAQLSTAWHTQRVARTPWGHGTVGHGWVLWEAHSPAW